MPQNVGLPLFDVLNDVALAAFGEAFSWIKGGGVVVEGLTGIFDARHYEAEVGGEVGVSDYQVSLSCRRDAVDGICTDHQVVVRETVYDVRDLRPDSEGWVVLVLREAD